MPSLLRSSVSGTGAGLGVAVALGSVNAAVVVAVPARVVVPVVSLRIARIAVIVLGQVPEPRPHLVHRESFRTHPGGVEVEGELSRVVAAVDADVLFRRDHVVPGPASGVRDVLGVDNAVLDPVLVDRSQVDVKHPPRCRAPIPRGTCSARSRALPSTRSTSGRPMTREPPRGASAPLPGRRSCSGWLRSAPPAAARSPCGRSCCKGCTRSSCRGHPRRRQGGRLAGVQRLRKMLRMSGCSLPSKSSM